MITACRREGILQRTALHGSSTVRYALRNPSFEWQTYVGDRLHLHVEKGSWSAANAPQLANDAQEARAHVLRLLETQEDSATLEIFLVDTRDDMKRVAGQSWAGWAQTGEKTAFFVAGSGFRPAFRHELMHAYSLLFWGEPPSGPWIIEGLATLAAGNCQGKPVEALVAGFANSDSLYPLPVLVDRFREIPEVRGYLQAASVVETIYRDGGISAVRERWQAPRVQGAHPLGQDGPRLEAEWRGRLAASTPAMLDTLALRKSGC